MDRFVYTLLNGNIEGSVPRLQMTNEMANLSTTGFKRSFVNATNAMKIVGPGFDSRFAPVNAPMDRVSLQEGPRMVTGNPLDIAMNGNTLLGVTAPNGDLAFTRRGDMRVNSAGQLEIGTGQTVRGQNGILSVPPGYALEIAGDGSVYANPLDKTTPGAQILVGQLLLRDASGTTVERREDGLFKPGGDKTPGGGDFKPGNTAPSISNGTLEGSNVSAIEVMVRLLDSSRSFEAQMRFIKEGSSLDDAGSSMMKGS